MSSAATAVRCVHELFEAQATRAPAATALIAGDSRISYAELDARADRLAASLVDAGVRRGSLVGVRLGRCTDLVVAILAVLKAGAGYLVLDPEFPPERLRSMAEAAGVVIVVAPAGSTEFGPATRTVPVDAAGAGVLPRGSGDARPDDAACVMFTSGSTGGPKAVLAPHRAIVGTLVDQTYLPFTPGTVWLQCAPISWDAFVLELWGALLFGGSCVLHPGPRPDPVVVARLVAEHSVTAMYLSSSLFNVIVDEYPAALDGIAQLVVGGEALSPAHLGRVRSRFPGLRLTNGYGPVETMIFLTTHPVTAADTAAASVPIGRPLAGKTVRVLDAQLRPVADGETGELYAAGVGLAHGYLGAPATTAQRFVADPYGPPGTRLYRTGDLVRWHTDAPLEYLGRADRQVKIRGFRVEPGEVETVLARHPAVRQVAVVADTDGSGDRRLLAYVVAAADPQVAPSPEALSAHSAAQLPDFMVPAAFVLLDALPLTATGKLDRSALPAPGAPDARRPAGAAAETVAQQALCALFAEILGLPAVGIDDDFFALGGNSLQVARLLSRVHTALGVEIGVRAVFETPTVAALARHLDGAALAPAPTAPAAHSRPADGLPLSAAQRRLWFLDQIDAGAAYTMPILLRLTGPVDADVLRDALSDVVDRHETLRTVFTDHDGEPGQQILRGEQARPRLETVTLDGTDLEAGIVQAARHRFDLATELPVRAVLFSTRDQAAHALLLVMHHIAVDGWSLPPLLRDLSEAYRSRLTGASRAALPEPVRYLEHTARQAARLGDPADPDSVAGRQLSYWHRALDALPGTVALPRRPECSALPDRRAATVLRRLDATGHAALVGLARRYGATLFMVLHAGLTVVLHRAGAGPDIAVGAPVAGRTGAGADDAVGFFVNMLILRSDLSGDPTLGQLLDRVREADLAALAHQDVPFEQVVAALNPTRPAGRQPWTDVVLALQNNVRAAFTVPGVTSRLEVVRTGTARFELLVDVTDEYGPDGAAAGLALTVEYQDEVFAPTVVEWLADAYLRVLRAMTGRPGQRLSELPGPPPPPVTATTARMPAPTVALDTVRVAPRTDLERRLAGIWADVLDLPEVGVHDNFFALGGNSLRAVRLAARVTTTERLPATAAQLFSAPTVAQQADALTRSSTVPDTPIPRRPRVPRRRPDRSGQ